MTLSVIDAPFNDQVDLERLDMKATIELLMQMFLKSGKQLESFSLTARQAIDHLDRDPSPMVEEALCGSDRGQQLCLTLQCLIDDGWLQADMISSKPAQCHDDCRPNSIELYLHPDLVDVAYHLGLLH